MGERILAKSVHGGVEIDLLQHSEAVLHASELLFGRKDSPTPLGKSWLRFFGLDWTSLRPFLRNLRLSCLLHDLGKANDGFQRAVRRRGEQKMRHEHLSALIAASDPLRGWMKAADDIDAEIVQAAIASHHSKASHKGMGGLLVEGSPIIRVEVGAREFAQCLERASGDLDMVTPTNLDGLSTWDRARVEREAYEFKLRARRLKQSMRVDSVRRRLVVAVKAALVSADAAASGLTREGVNLENWLSSCFERELLTGQWVREGIIGPRMAEIEKRTRRRFKWLDFQEAVGGLGRRAVLVSPCGSGKTLAAWRWIQAQLEVCPASRIIFLYPTRVTATEGFRDYVSWAGGETAALVHSTSEYDLGGMFENPGDPRREGDYSVRERLFALGYWPKRVFSATVDAFLAFMRNQYASLCMLPVLCDSIVVIDEVHSFTQGMFTALERFLKFFDVPVLCMTATLPDDRLAALKEGCGMEVFPAEKQKFADLKRQASLPRYRLRKVKGADQARKEVEKRLRAAGGKQLRVLWVVNTVDRCQGRYREARELSEFSDVLCYHSRFKLSDRKARHNDVIRRFRETAGPLLLVTTQVCEMSLDLDADVLVTETAPVPSLIQRMGRCCREPEPKGGRVGFVFVYAAEEDAPYEHDEMQQGKEFLGKMARRRKPLSQADLAAYLTKMDIADPFPRDGHVGFLDDGMYASAHDDPFREGDDYTVDCVLDSDVDEFLRMRRRGDPDTAGFILPVPRRLAECEERLGRHPRMAPASHYSASIGFCQEEIARG